MNFFWTMAEGKFGYREDDSFMEIRLDTVNGRKDIVLQDLIEGYCPHKLQLTLWGLEEGRELTWSSRRQVKSLLELWTPKAWVGKNWSDWWVLPSPHGFADAG